jgi:hypothetical protein
MQTTDKGNRMKFLAALALGAALLGSYSPASAQGEQRGVQVAQMERQDGGQRRSVTKVVVRHSDRGMHRGWDNRNRRVVTKKVIVTNRDRGMHRGWDQPRHRGATVTKKVVITR